MIRRFIVAIALIFAIIHPSATQAQLEKIYSIDSIEKLLRQDKFEIDGSADAIILFKRRKATLHYARHNRAWEFTDEVVIKVLSNQAKDLGQLSIPYMKDYPFKNIFFENYSIVDGKINKIGSSEKDIISEKVTGKLRHAKFQIPNVTDGSIIYYTYTIKTPFFDDYLVFAPTNWNFASDYPTVHSRFELNTRDDKNFEGFCNFTTFKRESTESKLFDGDAVYFKQLKKAAQGSDEFIEKKEVYARNKILPNVDEPFSINKTANNYILTFRDVSKYGSAKLNMSWDTANIGINSEIQRITSATQAQHDSLKSIALGIVGGETDTLAIAKIIYSYVRDSISRKGADGYSNLVEVAKSKKGSHGEKVLLAVHWLNIFGIKAISVITSADENQPLDPDRYDHDIPRKTILAAVISGSVYYLDPNSKYPFGLVSPDFLSGFAWGVTGTGIPMELNRSILSNEKSYEINLTPTGNDTFNFQMKLMYYPGELDAVSFRKSYAEDSNKTKETFIASIADLGYQTRNVVTEFKGVSDLDSPLALLANLQIKIPLHEDIEHISPLLLGDFKENPFKSVQRINPVEFRSRLNYQYKISMQLPDDYEIDELPEPKSVNLPGNAITFSLKTSTDGKSFTLYNNLNINKCVFDQTQYSLLRKYFESLTEAQSRKITVKKNKGNNVE